MGASAAIIGTVFSIGSTVIQSRQQSKQQDRLREANERQMKIDKGIAAVQDRKERQKLIREASRQRALQEVATVAQGGGATTSMGTGALAANNTNLAVNLADFQETQSLQRQSTLNQSFAANAQIKAQNANAYMQLGQYGFEQLGGFRTLLGPMTS